MTQHLISGSYERFIFAHKVQHAPLGIDQVWELSFVQSWSAPTHDEGNTLLCSLSPLQRQSKIRGLS